MVCLYVMTLENKKYEILSFLFQNGLNALHLASKEGYVNVVTELLNRGANIDAATKVCFHLCPVQPLWPCPAHSRALLPSPLLVISALSQGHRQLIA